MNQNQLLNCRLHELLAILLSASLMYMSSVAFAEEAGHPIQEHKGFKILYHETLDFNFEPIPNGELESQSNSVLQNDATNTTMMSFDAFDQHFELVLQSNKRLIAHLPRQQRENLNNSLQLYRGKLKQRDDSWVRITKEGNRVSGMIWDGSEIFVIDNSNEVSEALTTDTATNTSYPLIYKLADTETDEQLCALDASATPMNNYQNLVNELTENVGTLPLANAQLDIAVVADTQFVNNNSNSDSAVVSRMNVVDGIFSEQVGVHLSVAEIRSLQNNGGLTSSDPGTLLTQFGNFSDSAGFNNPGLAHLFTGRDLSGSTIGIAYLDSLCNSKFGVGVSQVNGDGTAGALTVAHELGHNFGSPHDNQSGSPCASTAGTFLMNPSLNGSDQFSQCSINQMQPAVQNATCITDIDGTPVADVRINLPENPVSANVNQAFDFIVEIQNTGDATATDVTANIAIADELTIQAAETNGGSCTSEAGQVICNLDNIDDNDQKTVTLTLQAEQTGSFVNSIQIAADNDENSNNNEAEAIINVQDTDNSGLFEAHFDTDSEQFVFIADSFRNTNQPKYARGNFNDNAGFEGGGLKIIIGGRDNNEILDMSGAWERSFSLDNSEIVTLSFRYRLTQYKNFEEGEISEALVAIDGELLSNNGVEYLAQIHGNGDGGSHKTTGWQLVNFNLGELSAGTHTLTIGGYNSKKTLRNHASQILIDDVIMTKDRGAAP